MHRTLRPSPWELAPHLAVVSLLLLAAAGLLCSGCTPGADVTMTSAPPHDGPMTAQPGTRNPGEPAMASVGQPQSSNLSITAKQRGFLDALDAAGVHASNNLTALSIGSYICQAHTAGQSDDAVRDFVLPLIRGDLHQSRPGMSVTSLTAEVEDATAAYIRIATDRLC